VTTELEIEVLPHHSTTPTLPPPLHTTILWPTVLMILIVGRMGMGREWAVVPRPY
jgi:hypothetical protein